MYQHSFRRNGIGRLAILVSLVTLAACDRGLTDPEIARTPKSAVAAKAPGNFGAQVGSYNGVVAYSNGSASYFSNVTNSYNGYVTGYRWQCVEYVVRYFKAVFGRQIRGGNANAFYANAASKGLNRAPNGGTDRPRPGNLIQSNGGANGHVAIVRAVGDNYVDVIQQNFTENSGDNSYRLSMTVTTDRSGQKHYTVGGFSRSYPIVGWMWPK